jgi:hypothetical protein
MKKIKISLIAVLMLFGMVASVQALYIVKRTLSFTARVNVTGFTNTALAASVFTRLYDAPSAGNIVSWTNISLPLPNGTKWKIANDYVKVVYTNFVAPWGISFATENTNTVIAKPRFTGSVDNASVLVASNTPNTGLQLVWQVQQLTSDYQPVRISDPVGVPLAFTNTGWSWKYIAEQNSSAWTNKANNAGTVGTSSVNYYSVPLYSGSRLWGSAAGERGASTSPIYFYLAADFSTATIQVFKTTALTLEMYKP